MSRLKSVAAVVVGALLIFVVYMWGSGTDESVAPATEASGAGEASPSVDAFGPKRPRRDPTLAMVDFIRLEGGKFLMGAQSVDSEAPGYDPDAGKDEGPPRWVTLDAFEIQRTEVRAAAYQECVEKGECGPLPEDSPLKTIGSPARLAQSVNLVTWDEASKYCASIGARLPTEAEWEYAARGTEGFRFPFGDSAMCPLRVFEPARPAGPDTQRNVVEQTSPCDHIAVIAAKNMEDKEVKELEKIIVGAFTDSSLNTICLHLEKESEEKILELLRAIQQKNSVDPLTEHVGLGVGALGHLTSPVSEDPESDEEDEEDEEDEDETGGNKTAKVKEVKQEGEAQDCALAAPPNPSDMVGDHPHRIEQLAGGMWEWVSDYHSEAYVSDENVNPQGPESGTRRVQRGGGWMSSSPVEFRGAARASLLPTARMPDVGFRCARSL